MENQNNLKKPLLSESVDPSSCHQKDVAKKKKLNQSRSAPLIVSLPGDFPTVDHEPNLNLNPSLRDSILALEK
uniref:Uncharacterized protein n=1 Tax=Chenopodium quinoa TaxID=63459 RepID=A0A803MWH6_CHEQI